MMTQETINRYQPGGDIFAKLTTLYGLAAANSVASAALTGEESAINAALAEAKYGAPLETSTAVILTNQLLTDPLAAPLDGLERILGNTLNSLLASPVTLALGAGVVWLLFFGGLTKIKKL